MQLSLPFDIPPPQLLRPIRDRLIAIHGPQRDQQRHDPNAQFLKAMLSSRTYDAVSNDTFLRVLKRFPSLEDLAHMNPAMLAEVIHKVTYAADKAVYLVEAAQFICARRGQFDLTFLTDRSEEDARYWLQQIRGIGSKVAAVILNFSTLRKRTFAIDTHVLRVFKRLGIVRPKANFEHAYKVLMGLVPNNWDADDLYELHWLVKMHGQTRCRHLQPICAGCPLARLCPNHTAATLGRK